MYIVLLLQSIAETSGIRVDLRLLQYLRWYTWVRFEPKMGTLLAPWRGSRPVFFALAELSASLSPVYRFYLGRGDEVLPRRRARKGGDAATNRFANYDKIL